MRFCVVLEVPKKSGVARLFKVFATAVLANFQDRLVMTTSISLRIFGFSIRWHAAVLSVQRKLCAGSCETRKTPSHPLILPHPARFVNRLTHSAKKKLKYFRENPLWLLQSAENYSIISSYLNFCPVAVLWEGFLRAIGYLLIYFWRIDKMETIEIVFGILLLVMALFLIIAVVLQSGKDKSLSGSITGSADTFFSKSKANTWDRMLDRATVVVSALFALLVIIMYIIV